MSTRQDELGLALVRFMTLLHEARSGPYSHDHPALEALRSSVDLIEALLPPGLSPARVEGSVGRGNWARVPWIAVLHPAVTTSTQRGTYPVLLFREDLTAVEITIAQGITDLRQALGRPDAVAEMHRRSEALRPALRRLERRGFALDADADLGDSPLGRDYAESTVVHRRYDIDELPTSNISVELAELLEAYEGLVDSHLVEPLEGPAPTESVAHAAVVYVGLDAATDFETVGRQGWWGWKDPPSHMDALRPGDLIMFGRGFNGDSVRVSGRQWLRHRLDEVVVGRIVEPPRRTDEQVMPDELDGTASYPWKLRFERLGRERAVPLAAGARLSREASDALRLSAINRGIGILVPIAGSPLLEEYMNNNRSPGPPSADTIAACSGAFSTAVSESGLRYAPADVVAFLAAVLAKPFTILTGLSGSGKTQLAMRLGEWFGTSRDGAPRCHVAPVRPDWTGPEYLFGYRDALQSGDGREVWAVPDVLEFILRAHAELDAPYLLVLDEMNLAHVERYFADFLSGLESDYPVLPEVRRDQGEWIATGNTQRLPLPNNLFVVGTVNVDETTYMFSPKVLDRAFTFEFRTEADDLDPAQRRPQRIASGDADHLAAVAGIAADDDWQHANPHPDAVALADDLRALHRILAGSKHEFGHRVLYEAVRYSAVLHAMGMEDQNAGLDRIVLTKLLPKLHGTRSRLEPTLRALRDFADGGGDAPRLPLSARKVDSMIATLVEAQFVSFTE